MRASFSLGTDSAQGDGSGRVGTLRVLTAPPSPFYHPYSRLAAANDRTKMLRTGGYLPLRRGNTAVPWETCGWCFVWQHCELESDFLFSPPMLREPVDFDDRALMNSSGRSQAQGKHARDEPADSGWRYSQCSGSESLELSGRPVQGPSILPAHRCHGVQPT